MTPQRYCRTVCKKSGSNFVKTFYFLGRKKRRAMEAFYAFCRVVDDCVDEAPNPAEAARRLAFWKEEIARLYAGKPTHPLSQALRPVVRDFEIPPKLPEEILAGCETDIAKKEYATFEELERYCYRVASCVGLVTLKIFGLRMTPRTTEGAVAMGKALQITNILRDIVSDLKRGRIYLPEEDFRAFRVTKADLVTPKQDNMNLIELLYFETDRALAFFKEAWGKLPATGSERRRMLAARLMGRFYEEILKKIRRDPLKIFEGKIGLTGGEKIRLTLRELWQSLAN